jgi:hypothetical protein
MGYFAPFFDSELSLHLIFDTKLPIASAPMLELKNPRTAPVGAQTIGSSKSLISCQ